LKRAQTLLKNELWLVFKKIYSRGLALLLTPILQRPPK
jgi:hypothetical protein